MGELRGKKIYEMVKNGLSFEDVAILYGLKPITVEGIYKKLSPIDTDGPTKYEKRKVCRQKPIKDYGVIQCPDCGRWLKPTSGSQLRCKECGKKKRRARYEAKKNAGAKDRAKSKSS